MSMHPSLSKTTTITIGAVVGVFGSVIAGTTAWNNSVYRTNKILQKIEELSDTVDKKMYSVDQMEGWSWDLAGKNPDLWVPNPTASHTQRIIPDP